MLGLSLTTFAEYLVYKSIDNEMQKLSKGGDAVIDTVPLCSSPPTHPKMKLTGTLTSNTIWISIDYIMTVVSCTEMDMPLLYICVYYAIKWRKFRSRLAKEREMDKDLSGIYKDMEAWGDRMDKRERHRIIANHLQIQRDGAAPAALGPADGNAPRNRADGGARNFPLAPRSAAGSPPGPRPGDFIDVESD